MTPETRRQRKRELRKELRERRAKLPVETRDAAAHAVVTSLQASPLVLGSLVAGYWPIGEELDPRPLMASLEAQGHTLALPITPDIPGPLLFRQWRMGEPLQAGRFGTSEPRPEAPVCRPDVLLLPLLAFTKRGDRLGYGGGFYDRTIAALLASAEELPHPKPLLLGLAFSCQELGTLPTETTDQPLDWIITEKGCLPCLPSAAEANSVGAT